MKKRMCLLIMLVLYLFASLGTAETEGDFTYSISSGSAAVTAYTGSAAELTVPDTLGGYPVTSICYCAFRNCTSLVQITLPDGVTSIDPSTFASCTGITFIAPAGSAAQAFARANAESGFQWRAPQ